MTKNNKAEKSVEEMNNEKAEAAKVLFEACVKEIDTLGFIIVSQPFIRPDGGISAAFNLALKPEKKDDNALAPTH